jgi:hypothetical protein
MVVRKDSLSLFLKERERDRKRETEKDIEKLRPGTRHTFPEKVSSSLIGLPLSRPHHLIFTIPNIVPLAED